MAITAYPFDNQDTTETQYSDLFRELQDTGVVDTYGGNGLRVAADGSGMTVTVQPGFAIVRGHAVLSTAIETLTIPAASPSARVDRIILRLDPVANTIGLAVKAGTPGSSVPVALTQTNTDIFEAPLATIAVASGATNIALVNVTDERQFSGSRVRAWSTLTRPANPRVPQLGFNVTNSTWEFWNGVSWSDLAPMVTWDTIQGKPSSFASGSHTHPWGDITEKPTTFTPTPHGHSISEVNGLQSQLNGMASAGHTHSAASTYSRGGNVQSDIDWLATYKAASNHGHDFYNQTTIRSDGTARAHAYAIGGGGNWYSVWVDGGGWFCRNTSSIRYKENVRDIDFRAEDVLALTPRIYDRKDDVAPDGTPRVGRKDEFGLIAEEVHATMPELVQYEDGEIDSVRYDLVGVALLKVVQEQQKQIAELQSQVASLMGVE